MSFISIPQIYTADARDIFTPKSAFESVSDPFAIVMIVNVSDDVIQAGHTFKAVFQMVNPRDDPYPIDTGAAWYTYIGDLDDPETKHVNFTTIDTVWEDASFSWGTDFGIMVHWDRYDTAIDHVWGPGYGGGIFFARGIISVRNSELFAHSPEFWYKVGYTPL